MTHPDNGHNSHADDRSVLSIIRDIQQGTIEAKSLAIEDRRRCVEHLTVEGYSAAETAEILKVTERTIARDRAAIRRVNAVNRDPKMTGEMVGQLFLQADSCIQRIRRATRERDTPPQVRVEGEKACWIIRRDLAQLLQTLGFLPTAPQEIRGELTHQIEQLPRFSQLQDEVARLEVIYTAHPIGDDVQPRIKKLAELKDQVARGALQEQIAALQQQTPDTGGVSDDNGN